MALKGNLLYNGDFETGTTEGWINGAFGKSGECVLSASEEAKLRGNYGGMLTAQGHFNQSYIAYDKMCSFEEYEAFLYILPIKMVAGIYTVGYLYGLDDKGNLIDDYWLGYNNETGSWRTIKAILRGFGDIIHFKVGVFYYAYDAGDKLYFDEVKLIPLRSIKGHEIADYRYFDNLTADKEWYSLIACIGKCKLRSIVRTAEVSGTDPTLDVTVDVGLLDNTTTYLSVSHTTFTGEATEEKIIDVPEVCWLHIKYTLGGTSPSFDIYHHLRIEPY